MCILALLDFSVPSLVNAVVGKTGVYRLNFSSTDALVPKVYNLRASVNLPNGVSFVDAFVVPDIVTQNSDGTITIQWTDIKDLAYTESYYIDITLKADEQFRPTILNPVPSIVPFNANLPIEAYASIDTKPRGSAEPDNVVIQVPPVWDLPFLTNFIPKRYSIQKSGPGKIPKGAGTLTLTPALDPLWSYDYTIAIINNTREPSIVDITDTLPNGVRYLGQISVLGPNALVLSTPAISLPTPAIISPPKPEKNNVDLFWDDVTLSIGSENTINFKAAIWNYYTINGIENSGAKILHAAGMINNIAMDLSSGTTDPVSDTQTTLAMDVTIHKNASKNIVDVGSEILYTITYRCNQYDDILNFDINDILYLGQTYMTDSASPPPYSVSSLGATTILWTLGTLITGTTGSITFKAKVAENYDILDPVSAGDTLINHAEIINATNAATGELTPDNTSVRVNILKPTISKSLLNIYYSDGVTPKTIPAAAPGDIAEFRIDYTANSISAVQRKITISEYAPLDNMGPLNTTLLSLYNTNIFTPPQYYLDFDKTGTNGLVWGLGNVPGNSYWTAVFRIPVNPLTFNGTKNNLAKLSGENSNGLAYSDRALVPVLFGKTELSLSKSVDGPSADAIEAGQTYTYTINVQNPQNTEQMVTDAFLTNLLDTIPSGLTYVLGTINIEVTGGAVVLPPSPDYITGQNLSMVIGKLPPNGTVKITYQVMVDSDIPSGAVLTNSAVLQEPYSQDSILSYRYDTGELTASATLSSKGITLSKLVTPAFLKIGDLATYILTVIIPKGTTAYNLKLEDYYLFATQSYEDNATRTFNSLTLSVTPFEGPYSPDRRVVRFTENTPITAGATDAVILYTFQVRLTDALPVNSFVENQVNNATKFWDLSPLGPAKNVSASANLEARIPNVTLRKEQRALPSGTFRTGDITYSVGDQIEYKLTATNTGAATAYNTVVTDNIDATYLDFISFSPPGSSVIITPGNPTVLQWTISELAPGETSVLTFIVETKPGIAPDDRIQNKASYTFNSNDNTYGKSYGPFSSNTVTLRSKTISLTKQAYDNSLNVITTAKIGDEINYVITALIPFGTIASNVFIEDALPLGQNYIGPASVEYPMGTFTTVVPTFSGGYYRFIPGAAYDASVAAITVKVYFKAVVVSAAHVPPFMESAVNKGRIKWTLPGGSTRTLETTKALTIKVPNLIIKKEQSFSEDSGFTTDTLQNLLPGSNIYYKFTVTSNGEAPAFDITITDVFNQIGLSNILTFNIDVIVYSTIFSSISIGWTGAPDTSKPTLIGEISHLDKGQTAVLILKFSVVSPVVAFDRIYNEANIEYYSNISSLIYRTFYEDVSNFLVAIITGLQIAKATDPIQVIPYRIGDTITYLVTIVLPTNIQAYSLKLHDNLPSGQQFTLGNTIQRTVLGVTTSVFPDPSTTPNSITYTEPALLQGPLVIEYRFPVTVTNSSASESSLPQPYVEVQRNTAHVNWRYSYGETSPTLTSFYDVRVGIPHLRTIKYQRKVTAPLEDFTTEPLIGLVAGDEIQYKIEILNDGAASAYSVITEDIISDYLEYLIPINPILIISTASILLFDTPIPPFGGKITWNNFDLAVGETVQLIVQLKVLSYTIGNIVTNKSTTEYKYHSSQPFNPGTSISNTVTFDFKSPSMKKYADKLGYLSGDKAKYTIELNVPSGATAFDIVPMDTIPSSQFYVSGSAAIDGISISDSSLIITPTSITFLLSDTIGPKDIVGPKIVRYSYEVTVTTTSHVQERQENTASIVWNIQSGTTPGPTLTNTAFIYVTSNNLFIEKSQRNRTTDGDGPPYTKSDIFGVPGDIILYQLYFENTGINTIYNIRIEDVLTEYASNPVVVSIDKGMIFYDPFTKILLWDIDEPSGIAPNENFRAVIALQVPNGVGAGDIIKNSLTAEFTAIPSEILPDYPLIIYTALPSDEVILNIKGLEIEKTALNPLNHQVINSAELNQEIQYMITVLIPANTAAFNIKVHDLLPLGQEFSGSASLDLDGIVTPVMPVVSPDNRDIQFSEILSITPSPQGHTLVYSFNAVIVSGDFTNSFAEQTNSSEASWKSNGETETPVQSIFTEYILQVTKPFFFIAKLQRNVTDNTAFSIDNIDVKYGDTVGYRIVVHNLGQSPAYNIVLNDIFPVSDQYVSYVVPSIGSVSLIPPLPSTPSQIIWSIDELPIGSVNFLDFFVTEIGGIAAGDFDKNISQAIYKTTENTSIVEDPVYSNEVLHYYPMVTLSKSSDVTNSIVGTIIRYAITGIVPKGTFVYNGNIYDVLPIGQIYNDNATINGVPAVFNSDNQLVNFISNSFVDARERELIYIFEFDAKIDSVFIVPPSITEVQTDEAYASWTFDEEGTKPSPIIEALSDVIITNRLISLFKSQMVGPDRLALSVCNFFESKAMYAKNDSLIQYKLTVKNTGEGTVYNVKVFDILSSYLKFIDVTNFPLGNSFTHTGEAAGGTLIWSIPMLLQNESLSLIMTARTEFLDCRYDSMGIINNSCYGLFTLYDGSSMYYFSPPSNTVTIYSK